MTKREQEILGKSVEILARELKPNRIYLFGSRAKGKEQPGSDFDFAVDVVPPDVTIKRQTKEMLEAVAGLYSIDVVFLDEVDPKFKQLIFETAKVVYEQK